MIVFKVIHKDMFLALRQDLQKLYLDTFTKGLSAQHITSAEATKYLDSLFNIGYAVIGFTEKKPIAALIAVRPSYDKEQPENISQLYTDTNTLYIAEVLVDKSHRGMGLGKKLFDYLEENLDPSIKNLLLRVWDQNQIAVNLYKKRGFKKVGSIAQTKYRPVSKEPFTMQKIYMLKTY